MARLATSSLFSLKLHRSSWQSALTSSRNKFRNIRIGEVREVLMIGLGWPLMSKYPSDPFTLANGVTPGVAET